MRKSMINFADNRFLMFVIDQMAYEYEKKGKDIIRMTLGKCELPLHPRVIGAMKGAITDHAKSSLVFPAGLPELRARLAREFSRRFAPVKAGNIVIGAGTSSLIRNLFTLLLEKSDEVLLPLPYYPLYYFSALLSGAKIRYYRFNKDLSLDRDSFQKGFTRKTRVVVVNSPGNPLGNIISKKDLEFIDRVAGITAQVISDEIYSDMCFDHKSTSALELRNPRSSFIITGAFSKGYRMYCKRVGFCILPAELVLPMSVIQQHTLLTLDPVVQYGALAALDLPGEQVVLRRLYGKRRDYALENFKGVKGIYAYPSQGGFYLTIDCGDLMRRTGIKTSLELAKLILTKSNVAVVPGSDFGLPSALRISFTTGRFNEGIDRIAELFQSSYKL